MLRNIHYKREIGNCFNLYEKFTHVPHPGDWPNIEKLVRHVFGEQYELGLDYIQLLYQIPTQILPVLCLVAKENQSGKTTFADFMNRLFAENSVIISNESFQTEFNGSYATKLVVSIDEGKIHNDKYVDKIKKLATDDTILLRKMRTDHKKIDFFAKFIILSNRERDFINITDEDVRFWVRKLKKITDFDPNFLDHLTAEIPAFLDFLCHRELSTKKQHRAWFPPEILNTAALDTLKKETRSAVCNELILGILEHMQKYELDKFYATASDLKELLFSGNSRVERTSIMRSLRDELKISALINKRFTNWRGVNAPGNPYLFEYDQLMNIS